MATTKTLTPTNETITIDAFQGEKPDYRHVADAEGKLADAVNALNSKTTYNGTANGDYISALEGKVVKNGSVVSGYFVLTTNADFSAADLTLISNLPAAYNQSVQLPCIGVSGTNMNKATRVRITTSGTITTWYGFGFKSGESYLISVNYICE